jgi:hypothetical protein
VLGDVSIPMRIMSAQAGSVAELRLLRAILLLEVADGSLVSCEEMLDIPRAGAGATFHVASIMTTTHHPLFRGAPSAL